MTTGLRERKRQAAMHAIQEAALDLFDERGFDDVTVEQIAHRAEVSPSSVYRHFGTKEGIVVADEFDAFGPDRVSALINLDDPVDTVRNIVRGYEWTAAGSENPLPRRRIHYFFSEPSIRRAVYLSMADAATKIAEVLRADGHLPDAQARVAAHACVFGYAAALEQWHLNGGTAAIGDVVEEGMAALSGLRFRNTAPHER